MAVYATGFQRFLSAIDISENLDRALGAIARIGHPLAQKFFAWGFLFPIVVVSGAFAWRFDFMSTIGATQKAIDFVLPSLPAWAAGFSTFFVFCLTIAPTVIEMGGAVFAKAGIAAFQILVWFFACFDVVTDGPGVNEFLLGYADEFNKLPAGISTIVWWICWVGKLLLASYFYEMIFVISLACFIFMVSPAAARAAGRSVGGMAYAE